MAGTIHKTKSTPKRLAPPKINSNKVAKQAAPNPTPKKSQVSSNPVNQGKPDQGPTPGRFSDLEKLLAEDGPAKDKAVNLISAMMSGPGQTLGGAQGQFQGQGQGQAVTDCSGGVRPASRGACGPQSPGDPQGGSSASGQDVNQIYRQMGINQNVPN
jgi:hypothetical protein